MVFSWSDVLDAVVDTVRYQHASVAVCRVIDKHLSPVLQTHNDAAPGSLCG
jgi:hypothetical protein